MRNIFAEGMNAYDDSFARTQAARQTRGRVQAGRALAAGDRTAAAAAFGEAGMPEGVRQVQDDQAADENQQFARDRIAKADERAEAERKVEVLTKVAQGLKGVQAGQRMQALQRAMPLFQQLQIDPSMFASLTEDQLTDEALDLFSGELEKQWQAVNLGGGGFGKFNSRSGEFETVREPTMRPVIVGNGATAVDPETGEPVYANPKKFAPARPRSPGGGISEMKTEDLLKALRAH